MQTETKPLSNADIRLVVLSPSDMAQFVGLFAVADDPKRVSPAAKQWHVFTYRKKLSLITSEQQSVEWSNVTRKLDENGCYDEKFEYRSFDTLDELVLTLAIEHSTSGAIPLYVYQDAAAKLTADMFPQSEYYKGEFDQIYKLTTIEQIQQEHARSDNK